MSKINSKLIAISGVKCSGKNATADMLQYCLSVPKLFRNYWFYKHFRRRFKYKWKKTAFADPLKRVLSIITKIPYSQFNNRKFKEEYYIKLSTLECYHYSDLEDSEKSSDSQFYKMIKSKDDLVFNHFITIRQLMQYFGTECAQTYLGRNVWINSTLNSSSDNIIVTDLRFIAEADAIKKRNGCIIYINRPNYEFGQHASEKEMSYLLENNYYDIIIDNSGSLKDLFNQIKNLVND